MIQSMMDCLYAKCEWIASQCRHVLVDLKKKKDEWHIKHSFVIEERMFLRYTLYHWLCYGGIGEVGVQVQSSTEVGCFCLQGEVC